MPLAGFLNAKGEKCSFEYALDNADTDEFPYPRPVMQGIVDQQQQRDYISVTSILHCVRAEFLKRTEPYYMTVDSAYAMFRGTLFHALMEKHAQEGARIEEKHVRTYKGVEIGGTFDSLRIVQEGDVTVLEDWKTTNNLPRYDTPYTSHIQQVNLYRWLVGLDPDKVRLVVWYFSMDGMKRTVLKDGKQQSRNGRKPQRQVWTDAEVEAFLDDRLLKLRASIVTKVALPYALVPQDDKWACPTCPVRSRCDELTIDEYRAAWRREEGLPPEGTDADGSALWGELFDEFYLRIKREFQPVAKPLPTVGEVLHDLRPAPKPPSRKRAARR
jgi:hypothetical protein